MPTHAIPTTVALSIAETSDRPSQHLKYLTALLGEGLGGGRDYSGATVLDMSVFVDALNRHGYRIRRTVVEGAYACHLVDYLPMPAQLAPALAERFTYVMGTPVRLPRCEWNVDDVYSACWGVATWAQGASADEVTCLAALLTSCLPIPVTQLLDTAKLVAA